MANGVLKPELKEWQPGDPLLPGQDIIMQDGKMYVKGVADTPTTPKPPPSYQPPVDTTPHQTSKQGTQEGYQTEHSQQIIQDFANKQFSGDINKAKQQAQQFLDDPYFRKAAYEQLTPEEISMLRAAAVAYRGPTGSTTAYREWQTQEPRYKESVDVEEVVTDTDVVTYQDTTDVELKEPYVLPLVTDDQWYLIEKAIQQEAGRSGIIVENQEQQYLVEKAIKAQTEKQLAEIAKQKDALYILDTGGYRSTKAEYTEGGAPFESYVTEGAYGYDVLKFIEDKPTQESIQVLVDAKFNQNTVDTAKEYVDKINETIRNFDNRLSLEGVREQGGIKGVDPNALVRAIKRNDIPLSQGSGVVTWRELSEEEKQKVIQSYISDPDRRNVFAGIAADLELFRDRTKESLQNIDAGVIGDIGEYSGRFFNQAATFIPIASSRLVDSQIEKFKNFDSDELEWVNVETNKTISNEEYKALGYSAEREKYVLSPESLYKVPVMSLPPELAKGTVETLGQAFKTIGRPESLATIAIMLAPFAKYGISGIKGVIARMRPDTLTGNAIALNTDVGRVQLPKGMSKHTARQLIEDVESAQLVGEIPISRVASYTDISKGIPDKVSSLDIVRDTGKGTVDIVLKSADGNVVGHVSGIQRVANDVIYHATGDTQSLMNEIAEKGYYEVRAAEGRHPVMYYSPQVAQSFMFRNPGKTPGVVAVRMSRDMWRDLPREVLDSPTLEIMRQRMFELARQGKLKPGVYPLNKGYGNPYTFEYEVVVAPGTKIYPATAKWYAPATEGAPMTRFNTDIAYDGSAGGVPVKYGQQMPMYWTGTEAAINQGLGVPSVIDFYTAKLLGDLTAIRKWMPWNLRFRPKPVEELGGVTSPNPLYSAYQQLKLKARPEDKGAGRVSGIIYNEKGEVLLTRTQGANHYDLPGGGTLTSETINKAMVREIYEETGLKPTYVEHVDTLQSVFREGGKAEKFQIFEVEATGKPLFGREVADYVWWDGSKKLPHDVSPFTRLALDRMIKRNAMIDNMAVAEIISEAKKKAELNKTVSEEVALANELGKVSREVERSIVPYRGMVNKKIAVLATINPEETPVYNEPPIDVNNIIGKNKVVVSDGVTDYHSIKTIDTPYVPDREYEKEQGEKGYAIEMLDGKESPYAYETTEVPEGFEVPPTIEPPEPPQPPEPPEPPEYPPPPETPDIFSVGEPLPPIIPDKDKPIIIPSGDKDSLPEKEKYPPGTVVWIQGRPDGGPMFKVHPPPYTEETKFTTRETPPGYKDMGWEGEGAAYESVQVIGGMPPNDIRNIDLGFARVNVINEMGKPRLEFVEDTDANIGERSMTVGMGAGQIPVDEWRKAKAQGVAYKDFVRGYSGKATEALEEALDKPAKEQYEKDIEELVGVTAEEALLQPINTNRNWWESPMHQTRQVKKNGKKVPYTTAQDIKNREIDTGEYSYYYGHRLGPRTL